MKARAPAKHCFFANCGEENVSLIREINDLRREINALKHERQAQAAGGFGVVVAILVRLVIFLRFCVAFCHFLYQQQFGRGPICDEVFD